MKGKIKRFFKCNYQWFPRIWLVGMFLFTLISYLVSGTETLLHAIVISAIAAIVTDFILIFIVALIVSAIEQDIEYNKLLKKIRDRKNKKAHRD